MKQGFRVRSVHLTQAGVYTRAVEGNQSATLPVSVHPLHPASGGSKHLCAPHGRIQASHSPPVGPTSQGGSSSLCQTPGLGCPICGLNRSFPREGLHLYYLLFPLSPLPGAQVLTQSLFFSSYLITYVSFLRPWLCKSPSASFQFVFSENCFTCRCIFGVFM